MERKEGKGQKRRKVERRMKGETEERKEVRKERRR